MTTANECYRPPVDAQLRYTVQWFHEWSEMQRGDFLPILAQKLAPGSYVNGLLSGVETLSCAEGRPPSLFQCRVKLFREWFETWSQAERDQLLSHIKSMDPGFFDKIQEELLLLSGKSPNGPAQELQEERDIAPSEDHEPVGLEPASPVVEPETESEKQNEDDLEADVANEEEDVSASS